MIRDRLSSHASEKERPVQTRLFKLPSMALMMLTHVQLAMACRGNMVKSQSRYIQILHLCYCH